MAKGKYFSLVGWPSTHPNMGKPTKIDIMCPSHFLLCHQNGKIMHHVLKQFPYSANLWDTK